MRYVKSCKSKDNPLRCGTLKIGSLQEYRDIEEEQIADKEEGFIELILKLDDIHLKLEEFQGFLNSNNSYSSFEPIGYLHLGGPSDAIDGFHHIPKFHAKSELKKNNIFIFCLSYLQDNEGVKISSDYDDSWSFSEIDIRDMALGLCNSLAHSIWTNRKEIFPKHELSKNFEVNAYWDKITYTPRKIIVDNHIYHTERLKYLDMVTYPQFVKPREFSEEKEFRICFEVYDNDILLHPFVKHIIISSKEVEHLIS